MAPASSNKEPGRVGDRPQLSSHRYFMGLDGYSLIRTPISSGACCLVDADSFSNRESVDRESPFASQYPLFPRLRVDPVVALKALCYYKYQSSEHPGWTGSPVKRCCDELHGWLIAALPGYEEAPWEIDDATRLPRAALRHTNYASRHGRAAVPFTDDDTSVGFGR